MKGFVLDVGVDATIGEGVFMNGFLLFAVDWITLCCARVLLSNLGELISVL